MKAKKSKKWKDCREVRERMEVIVSRQILAKFRGQNRKLYLPDKRNSAFQVSYTYFMKMEVNDEKTYFGIIDGDDYGVRSYAGKRARCTG